MFPKLSLVQTPDWSLLTDAIKEAKVVLADRMKDFAYSRKEKLIALIMKKIPFGSVRIPEKGKLVTAQFGDYWEYIEVIEANTKFIIGRPSKFFIGIPKDAEAITGQKMTYIAGVLEYGSSFSMEPAHPVFTPFRTYLRNAANWERKRMAAAMVAKINKEMGHKNEPNH